MHALKINYFLIAFYLLLLQIWESKKVNDQFLSSNSSEFEIVDNKIIFYDVETMEEINHYKADSFSRFHKFGYSNVTFEGIVWFASSPKDFLSNWNTPNLQNLSISAIQEEQVYNGSFWLMESYTYVDLVFNSNNTENNSTISDQSPVFDRESLRIPYDTQYYILYIPLNTVSNSLTLSFVICDLNNPNFCFNLNPSLSPYAHFCI